MGDDRPEGTGSVGFKTVQLLKDQTLGIGSYGKVCRAKCDDLLCAAKLIHETLFDPTAHQLIAPQREHRLPMRRFEQECVFLSTIKHPNIVQYLGLYRDPDTGLPALLMELMDDSLTHFLEHTTQPIPYHIQVNICRDITLALSFLHSNSIVHRDLSSNNVLLIGNAIRTKVTDFGMARLANQIPQATLTLCPGTDVFMPPEAVQDKPVYTEKIDCFSFGVITLQILTQQFPNPGDRRNRVEISHPGFPSGTMAEMLIPEIERRQNHISNIDPNHSLLQVSLDCLNDRDVQRPSAQQLCERLTALIESPEYSESKRAAEERNAAEYSDERNREVRSLKQQHAQQVSDLEQALRVKDKTIAAKEFKVKEQLNQISQLEREKNEATVEKEKNLLKVIEEKERQLDRTNQQLKESEQVIAQFQRRIHELEKQRPTASSESRSGSRTGIKMTWREGRKSPCKMTSSYNAIADSNAVYIRKINKVYEFTTSTSSWSQHLDSPNNSCPSVIVNNILTLVGGFLGPTITNKLFSLTGEGRGRRWTETFPPMPTKRYSSTALCTGTALIVAGGKSKNHSTLQTIEVMNTETLQWTTTANLPKALYNAPGVVCGDNVYILSLKSRFNSMYTCPVSALTQFSKSRPTADVWNRVMAPPVTDTTCVSILGGLLTIGGMDTNDKPTTAICMYNPNYNYWQDIGHIATPRCNSCAAVLPNNQLLMVVGGETGHGETDSVELATVELEC